MVLVAEQFCYVPPVGSDFLLNTIIQTNGRFVLINSLFNFANLIGGSAVIYAPLAAYRRHKGNAGNCAYVTGNKKYNKDAVTVVNLKNNLKNKT